MPVKIPPEIGRLNCAWQIAERRMQYVYATGIFVMGYGLVAIPKQLWRTANIRGQQRLLYHRAGVQAEKAIAARRSAS